MIRKEKFQNIFHIKEVNKKHQFRHYIILILLVIVSCGNSRPKQQVDTSQETNDKNLDFSDLEAYIIPQGIKYTESRAIDPAKPPIVIDIANRKLNIKKFDISDYYTKVRFIKLKHPKSATEGNFLFDAIIRIIENNVRRGSLSGINSQFRFTDDYIIAGDNYYGLHCYNKEGNFLYTLEENDFPKTYNVFENTISLDLREIKGFTGDFFLNRNICMYKITDDNNKSMLRIYDLSLKEQISIKPFDLSLNFINANSMGSIAKNVYFPSDTTRNFLFTFDIKGDTLCRFPNYNPISEIKGNTFFSPPSSDMYYYNDQLTIRQSINDTVYRVVSPYRLVPAFVLNFGIYKVDARTIFTENQPDKIRPGLWIENDQFILFTYTHGRNAPINRQNGLVKFFYSYFDKKKEQLYHFSEGTSVADNEFLIENPLSDALPFLLSKVVIENNQLRIYYNKKQLEEIINNKGFSSLPSEQQNRLTTLQKELDDNEVLIMFLE